MAFDPHPTVRYRRHDVGDVRNVLRDLPGTCAERIRLDEIEGHRDPLTRKDVGDGLILCIPAAQAGVAIRSPTESKCEVRTHGRRALRLQAGLDHLAVRLADSLSERA